MKTNVITEWIAIQEATPGASIAGGLRGLEAETGYHMTHSRLREFERGDRTPPPQVLRYFATPVAGAAIREALRSMGVVDNGREVVIPDRVRQRVAEMLTPPERK